jgi:hypothetical protein
VYLPGFRTVYSRGMVTCLKRTGLFGFVRNQASCRSAVSGLGVVDHPHAIGHQSRFEVLLAGLQKGDEQERRHKAEIPEAFEKLASEGLVTARSLLRRFGLFPYGTENPRDRGAGGWV